MVVADLAGYRFVTERDNPYDVVDLSEDLVAAPFPPSSALQGTTLAEPWVDADIRISFAKNKTHAEFGFALCVHNLLGALPLRDRAYHYRARLKPWDTCVDLLRATPVHVAIVDAIVSNHGSLGDRSPRPAWDRHDHRRHDSDPGRLRGGREDAHRSVRVTGQRQSVARHRPPR